MHKSINQLQKLFQVRIEVSNRFEISMRCSKFDFSNFPFDHQNCSIILRGPNSTQNITLINTNALDEVETKEEFTYESLNLQYEVKVTEFDTNAAQDSTSYVGVTLKFTRYFTPFSK